jgi:hypothetical protein
MVSLILKSPLAQNHVAVTLLQVFDHIREVFLLELVELSEGVSAGDVEVVLGFGLRGLEGARKDRNSGVLDFLGHLRVGEVLVNQDTVDELGILHTATGLTLYLDQIKVDILSGEISNIQHSLNSNFSQFLLILADNLRSQGNHRSVNKFSILFLIKLDLLGDLLEVLDSDIDCGIEAVSYFKGMEAYLKN